MLTSMQSSLLLAMQEQTTKLQASCASSNSDLNTSYNIFIPWSWGDRFHPVPDTFRFPKCNTRVLWDLWWLGNTVERYPPYRKLHGYDLKTKSDIQLLSRAKKVMKLLIEHHPTQILPIIAISSLSISDRDKYFELAFINLFKFLRPNEDVETFDRRRIGDISFLTLYDLICKKNI